MRRSGVSLVEVLVAIFIMAIGLITLLTLFPLGALTMKQAVQDNAAGNVAANAAALANARKIRSDDKVIYDADPNAPNGLRDVFVEPLPRVNKNTPNPALPPAGDGPGYPVFVDPIGYVTSYTHKAAAPVGGDELGSEPGIPRRVLRAVWGPQNKPNNNRTRTNLAIRWFSAGDDLQFNRDGPNAGTPDPITGPERDYRYSWAYLLQRPKASDPGVVDCAVVVFASRPPQLPLPEHVFAGSTFGVGTTAKPGHTITVPYSGSKPDIGKGSWVLDATLRQPNGNAWIAEPHGYFYRVVGVTDNGNSLTLETQEKVKGLRSNPNAATFTGILIHMESVVEVFDKGAGWQP